MARINNEKGNVKRRELSYKTYRVKIMKKYILLLISGLLVGITTNLGHPITPYYINQINLDKIVLISSNMHIKSVDCSYPA